jgi:DinB superfamily
MKRIVAALATLALPAVVAAQMPDSPTNPITNGFKIVGDRYAGWLMQAFDSIPAAKYSYKPTPVQLTIGYVAQHLEEANYSICSRFGGLSHAMTARDSLADSVKAQWPKEELVSRLKASVVFCDSAFAHVTDAQLTDPIPAGPPGSNRTIIRARYELLYVTDLVDHYSQIANYMRLNGLIPPSALPRRP